MALRGEKLRKPAPMHVSYNDTHFLTIFMIETVFDIFQALFTHLWIDSLVTGSLLEAEGLRTAVSCTDRALSYCLT